MVLAYLPQRMKRALATNSNYQPQGITVDGVPPVLFDTMAYDLDWFNVNFLQRIPLTINSSQVPLTQIDFPLLINDTYPDLIGEVEAELRFTGSDSIQLEYEIEKFDNSTGELIAWIKKPTVSDGDIIRIYFDNPAAIDEQNPNAVWDSNYKGVYHLNQATGANSVDSTSNNNDGVQQNSPVSVSAKIDDGLDYNGLAKTTQFNNTTPNNYTFSIWAKIPTTDILTGPNAFNGNQIVNVNQSGSQNDYIPFAVLNNHLSTFVGKTSGPDSSFTLEGTTIINNTPTVFQYFTVTRLQNSPNGELKLYINGVLEASATVDNGNVLNGQVTVRIGDDLAGAGRDSDGTFDEMRMSDIIRSADWIETEFNNQNDQSTFYSTGVVESVPTTFDIMAYEPDNWLDAQFLQRIPLTINAGEVPTTQTDFPLMIRDTFPDLIGATEAELRFASTDDIQLEYEIDEFDSITGELIAWIKKPSVSDGDILYVYFDNPTAVDEQNPAAVWSNNFVVVYHMNQTSGNILDSTINGNDGTISGAPVNAAGAIGNAKRFPIALDGYFTLDNDTLDTTNITVSMWIELSNLTGVRNFATKEVFPTDSDWFLGHNSLGLIVAISNNPAIITDSLSLNVKQHVAFVVVGVTTLNIYIDKVLVHTQTIIPKKTSSISRLEIASASNQVVTFLDEFHMSNDGKSTDWIETEFNNQRPTSNTFYTTSTVESVPTTFDSMGYES